MRRNSKLLTLVFVLGLTLAASAQSFTVIPQSINLDPPVCNPFCVTSQCTSHSDCTAQPNGRCNFACPGIGCCVYG